jgi:AcrR family transcriptional regulator
MYKYFKTKNELIMATLEFAHDSFIKNVIEKIDRLDLTPQEKIVKLFDTLQQFARDKDSARCLFIKASAEFPDLNDPIHQAATQHKLSTEKYIRKLLKEMKIKNSLHLSRVVTALQQWSLVMAQIAGDTNYYQDAKKIIVGLLQK